VNPDGHRPSTRSTASRLSQQSTIIRAGIGTCWCASVWNRTR